jgi:hypothetical protein
MVLSSPARSTTFARSGCSGSTGCPPARSRCVAWAAAQPVPTPSSSIRWRVHRRRGAADWHARTIELAPADRLGQVRGADGIGALHVGKRARHPLDALHRTRGQIQRGHGALEQALIPGHQPAPALGFVLAELGVEFAGAGQLQGSAVEHPGPYECGGFATRRGLSQVLWLDPRHRHVQVDAVEQRAGQAMAVLLDHVGGAAAPTAGIAGPPAGTGIHRRNELEARGKIRIAAEARHRHHAGFQRLAQGIERAALPFADLVLWGLAGPFLVTDPCCRRHNLPDAPD